MTDVFSLHNKKGCVGNPWLQSMAQSHSPNQPIIRIVSRSNGVGLDRDVQLIERALPAGVRTEHHGIRSWHSVGERLRSAIGIQRDRAPRINVLVERVPTTWAHGGGKNVLIPNQERFPLRHLRRLRYVDSVLCKSRHAQEIFHHHGASTRFLGFTSVDRAVPDVAPDFRKFLHVAGRSTLKGTQMLVSLWREHPQWPTLTIVQHPSNATGDVPANVNRIVDYLPDDVLQRMQNEHGVHLCPSLSEGWGHYIVEAMSCAAVVVTTDAPPMNELVDESRGYLVAWHRSEARHLGTNFEVDLDAMKRTVETVLASDSVSLKQRGQAARQWFDMNDSQFMSRAAEVIGLGSID